MAQGRDLYARVEPILVFGAAVLRLLPYRLVEGTYWIVQWIPGAIGYGLRYMWAKALAKSMGKAVKIGRHTIIRNWRGLEMGDHTGMNEWCYVDAIGGIVMGEHSGLGHQVTLVSFEHSWADDNLPMRPQRLVPKKTTIGRDCMIMAGVRILAGRTIGDRVVVAANSVVTRDLPESGIYGGIPAKRLADVTSATSPR